MLKVSNLTKIYPSFTLDHVSFELQKGYIMGFIGANGAGKSTTLKSMLNIIHRDEGEVTILGKDYTQNEIELKQHIGFMMGAADYYPNSKVSTVANIYKRFFIQWDEEQYKSLLKKFNIDERKKIAELSTSMKVKFGIALALSHKAQLLIFDEPTSGLDPIARDELLDLFQEIVEDGEHSILFSTHITSDLDKCADYIIFISHGKLIKVCTKDELIDGHALVEGIVDNLTSDLRSRMVSVKVHKFGFKGLIEKDKIRQGDVYKIEKPNLEDIMVYYNKEN